MLFANPDLAAASDWLNYGCFGVVVFIVFWAMTKLIPGAMDRHLATVEKIVTDHKAVVQDLSATFTKESTECREERRESVKMIVELQKAVLDLQRK